ncbi:unnamed protein product, partial [Staurois parvus]
SASINICERLCNKSIHEISLLLNIPRSTVSGIITKWKQLGTTAAQPQSGRPHKMTERGQRMLKHSVQKSPTVCNSSKLHVAFRLAQQQCIENFMEWVFMGEQLNP